MRVDGFMTVPALAGAQAALAGALLIGGWPGLPALAGATAVAAGALVATPLLLIGAVVGRDDSDVPRDRLVAPRTDADRAHRGPGELLDPLDVGPRVGRQLVEAPERRQVFEPAR
jgi:hypothetical protein